MMEICGRLRTCLFVYFQLCGSLLVKIARRGKKPALPSILHRCPAAERSRFTCSYMNTAVASRKFTNKKGSSKRIPRSCYEKPTKPFPADFHSQRDLQTFMLSPGIHQPISLRESDIIHALTDKQSLPFVKYKSDYSF